jgi:hypothetical protein
MSQPALTGKKVAALAGLAGLTALIASLAVAGCSSTKTTSGPDVVSDAAKPSDEADVGLARRGCPSPDPIDATKLSWKAPAVLSGSCTDQELADLVAFVDANSTAKYADWKAAVTNAGCNSCIFGKESDPTWKPLLEDATGKLVALNVGGCVALASGSESCGKSYQHWFDCRFEACADCPNGDTTALQKCLSAASKTACKKAFEDVTSICTDRGIGEAETTCDGAKFVFEGPIRAQCIGFKEGGE